MATKTLLLLMALCGLQSGDATVIYDVIDDMYEVINTSIYNVNTTVEMLDMVAQNVSGTAWADIFFAYEKIQDLVNQALANGVDISDCMETAQGKVDAALNASDAGISGCLAQAHDSVDPYLQQIQNDTKQADQLASQAAADFAACDAADTQCQTSVYEDTENQSSSIVKQVQQDEKTFNDNFWSIHGTLVNNCSLAYAWTAIPIGEAAYQEEKQCIEQKTSSA